MTSADCYAILGSSKANVLVGVAGLLLLAIAAGLSFIGTWPTGEAFTRYTVRLALAWYFVALFAMLAANQNQRIDAATAFWVARWAWTWGLIVFLAHVAMAFHYYHGWSHQRAFDHTRQASGTGEGIYVSYFFTLLWGIDVVWWWLAPIQYALRNDWIDRLLHAFMIFIVFNGAVVFASGPIRWISLACFVALPIQFFRFRLGHRKPTVF